jgi:hypothetical protein
MNVDPLVVTIVFALLNLGAVYAATFPYGLAWYAVLGVVVGMSFAIRLAAKFVFLENNRERGRSVNIQHMLYVFAIGFVSAILMLILLSSRFGFPLGFSIVVINGIIYAALNMLENKLA